jgi:cytochrome c556
MGATILEGRAMCKGAALIMCGFLGVFGFAVMAAEKPPDDYSKAMKGIGAAVESLTKAIQAEDFDAVSTSAGAIVDAIPVVEKYWTDKAEDAVKLAQATAKVAGDLRAVAGLKSRDGVAFSAKELNDTCMQCHAAHRETLPDGSFQIK